MPARKRTTKKKSSPVSRLAKTVKKAIGPKSAPKRTSSARKRERIDTTPGSPGGSRYVRRTASGQFGPDQVDVGRSLAADRRQKAKAKAKPGMKDRGD